MLIKICSCDRKRYLMVVKSVEEFSVKAKQLLGLKSNFRCVLEEDGTEIVDDVLEAIFEAGEKVGVIMILADGQQWTECQVQKSKVVAYLLWLILGWFGGHHFYLGRWHQGVFYFCTLGGFLGVGWLSDLWYMSQYVDDANDYQWTDEVNVGKPASFSFIRALTEFLFGAVTGVLMACAVAYAVPDYWLREPTWLQWLFYTLLSLAVAIGVHMIGNIGRRRCPFYICLLGALVPLPCIAALCSESKIIAVVDAICSATAANTARGRRWKTKKKSSACMSVLWAALHCILFAMLTLSAVLQYELINYWYQRDTVGHVSLHPKQTQPEWQHGLHRNTQNLRYMPRAVDASLSQWLNDFIQTFEVTELLDKAKLESFKLFDFALAIAKSAFNILAV